MKPIEEDGKPTYEELEENCKKLQLHVYKGIRMQQDLIKIQNKIDEDLRKFQLMNKYGQKALLVKSKIEFATLTLEYFIELYNEAKAVYIEISENISTIRSQFGMTKCKEGSQLNIDLSLDDLKSQKTFFLSSSKSLVDSLKPLGLIDAYICPILKIDKTLLGLIIVGKSEADKIFFPSFDENHFPSFTAMTQQVGSLLENLNTQKILQHEIEERIIIQKELTKSQEKLEKSKKELEIKVQERTKELSLINSKLQEEVIEREIIGKKLIEQKVELQRSNDDLSQFAAAVSHDLKSPLRNIATFSDLLAHKYQSEIDHSGQEYIGIISGGAKKMVSIIDGILQISNVSIPNYQHGPLDFNEVITSVIESLSLEIENSGATFHVGDLPLIMANRSQIERLFQNLIENAIKFSNVDNVDSPIISINHVIKDNQHQFSIKDNGIGIEDKYQKKIFMLFHRLHSDSEYEGTGIGLSICKRIVDRYKGQIWFESLLGQGSTFYFTIPRSV